MTSFRGNRGHDFQFLRATYFRLGAPPFPARVRADSVKLTSWVTDLRYQAGAWDDDDADEFVSAAARFIELADERT